LSRRLLLLVWRSCAAANAPNKKTEIKMRIPLDALLGLMLFSICARHQISVSRSWRRPKLFPPAAEGLVELDERGELVAPYLRELQLVGEGIRFVRQHFQVSSSPSSEPRMRKPRSIPG